MELLVPRADKVHDLLSIIKEKASAVIHSDLRLMDVYASKNIRQLTNQETIATLNEYPYQLYAEVCFCLAVIDFSLF